MTNELPQNNQTEQKTASFGARLRLAREALGIAPKDAAAQLRLNEKVITMLEKDDFPSDLPLIFVRGYMRSYGKFLQLSDGDIKEAVEPIKLKLADAEPAAPTAIAPKEHITLTSSNYVMQFFTYAIVLTLLGLVTTWWYNHTSINTAKETEKVISAPFIAETPIAAHTAAATPIMLPPVNTGNAKETIQIPFAPTAKPSTTNTTAEQTTSTANNTASSAPIKAAPITTRHTQTNDDDDDETE